MTRPLFARLTAASAFFLLIAGGLVTSTGSGLSVPDWPLSFGTLNPPMRGGVLFEHGHRLFAGCVAALTAVLSFWVWATETRRAPRLLAAAAAALILVQAVLGGMTVLLKLPPQVSIAHATLGQTVFCLLVLLADSMGEPRAASSDWAAVYPAAALAAFAQLVLGAVVRHTGGGVAWHIGGALAATALLAAAASRALSSDRACLRVLGWALAGLLPLQLCLGAGALAARRTSFLFDLQSAAAMTTAHLGVGALVLASAVLLAYRARAIR